MRPFLLLALLALAAAAPSRPSPFVQRSGTHLVLAGKPFRFGGANIEWLGVLGYGPADPAGPHPPSHYEVDDALATAKLLGATVVRSQTLGDSVGCADCLEPALGQFNAAAFARADYAVASARAHGLRLIVTLVGDDAAAGGGGCVYLAWRGESSPGCSLSYMPAFYRDPVVIGDVEQHISTLLDHVNIYTHVAWKDDPTILGWDLVNGGASELGWTRTISTFVRSIDRRHLILSAASNARLHDVDACVAFVYPHWHLPLAHVAPDVATCRSAGKPFIAYEYGWDRTNYPTTQALRTFLSTLHTNREIAGDAFWALEAHADGHGWLPIPADDPDPATAAQVESGEWWALYFPGVDTLVNTAEDMTARALLIRAHDYAMRGMVAPALPRPPAPTAVSFANGRLYWQGSVGAQSYSVQRAAAAVGPWSTVCGRCVTDRSDGWPLPGPGWYRVVPRGAGKTGAPSHALQAG